MNFNNVDVSKPICQLAG